MKPRNFHRAPTPLPFPVEMVRWSGRYLVANIAKHVGDRAALKGAPRIQIDVSLPKALDGDTVTTLATLGLYLVRDEPVNCAVRRLTFQAGGEPPFHPTTSWGSDSSGPMEAP